MAQATPYELSADQARRLRARAQRLAAPSPAGDVAAVLTAVCGVQAQDRRAAALSVRARSTGLTVGDVERSRLADRSVVRTWAMRGTFHLLPAADVRWVLSVLGPVLVAGGRRRLAELGFDEGRTVRAVEIVRRALERHGPRTRAELAEDLRGAGLDVDVGSQAVVHVVRRAALEGVLCVGPDRDGSEAYVALDDWVATDGRAPDGDSSLAELGRRYLEGYGPADPQDLAAWSGLPAAQARRAWRLLGAELVAVSVDGARAWALSRDGHAGAIRRRRPGVRLLPAFDTYLLGYRSRALAVDGRDSRRVWPGGGWIHPTVVVDGRVVATWRLSPPPVVVEPFDALPPAVVRSLEREAADVGRFLGVSTSLTVEAGDR